MIKLIKALVAGREKVWKYLAVQDYLENKLSGSDIDYALNYQGKEYWIKISTKHRGSQWEHQKK